ncbi:MAG: leucine-rich repeat domain-containing protein [Promethearchaeota archaeon]
MLKIFLSSTYRDLAEYRTKILDKLNLAFEGVGMEQFIPDGSNSQEVCIGKLKENNVVIFLISPYYGSLMDTCSLKEDCKAECPMKTGTGEISYTHCEYKTTNAEGILHQTYLVGEGWDAPDVRQEALQFREEIGEEYLGFVDIESPELVQKICNNLADKIIEWHSKKKLKFTNFCDRNEKLIEIIQNLDKSNNIEVYGVGGVGKTTLIQIALLIQRLKGKKIIAIGIGRSYASGSGYEDFRTQCEDIQYAISGNTISLYDILDALANYLPDIEILRKKKKNLIINRISRFLGKKESPILFIDDFHLADKDVQNMVIASEGIIVSSRKKFGIAKNKISIVGIEEQDRKDLIDIFCEIEGEELTVEAKQKIQQITEGHPVSTELLVKYYQNIDFEKLKGFNLKSLEEDIEKGSTQVNEIYTRVIEDILSPEAVVLLTDISILNTDLDTNIQKEVIKNSYDSEDISKNFNELVNSGMIKKKKGKEGIFEFTFKHIQDALEGRADKKNHQQALKYYEKKFEIDEKYTIYEWIEVLYHKIKSKAKKKLLREFVSLSDKIKQEYGVNRLIFIGKELLSLMPKFSDKIFYTLGKIYYVVRRFEESENSLLRALEIDEDYYNALILLGDLYTEQNKFKSARWAYNRARYVIERRLLEADKGVFDYVNIPDNAHERLSHIDSSLTNKKRLPFLLAIGRIERGLGFLYSKFEFEPLESYKKALDRYKMLRDSITGIALDSEKAILETHSFYNIDLYRNLGFLYHQLKDFEKAEREYNVALEAMRDIAEKKQYDLNFLFNLAYIKNNLGLLYIDTEKYEEAENLIKEALDLYEKIAKQNPGAYKPNVLKTKKDLGTVYSHLKMYNEAEKYYREALKGYKSLAINYPKAYLYAVADMQVKLGDLYMYFDLEGDLGNNEKAEKLYKKSLNSFNKLIEKNEENSLEYINNIAEAQVKLGDLYLNFNYVEKYTEVEELYAKSLKMYKTLADKYPDTYLTKVKGMKKKLDKLYDILSKPDKTDEIHKELLNFNTQVAKNHLVEASIALIHFDSRTKNWEVEDFLNKFQEHLNKALETDPNIDTSELEENLYRKILFFLGSVKEKFYDVLEKRNFQERAIKLLKILVNLNEKYIKVVKDEPKFEKYIKMYDPYFLKYKKDYGDHKKLLREFKIAIKELHVIICNRSKIKDISEIKSLKDYTDLNELVLMGNEISEIKGLESLVNLKKLDLSKNQITEIKGLDSLVNLEELDLSGNQITEIKGLESLVNLEELRLSYNQIKEIGGLDSLKKLVALNLSNNQITDVDELKNLTELKSLFLGSNHITEIGINSLKFLVNLKDLDLRGNLIKYKELRLGNEKEIKKLIKKFTR